MESEAALDVRGGADAFAALLSPAQEAAAEEEKKPEADEQGEPQAEAEAEAPAAEESEGEGEAITIEVDGKTVTLSKSELADAYKSGLRQADYTKKTMEAAELRKSADAEIAKARQERETFARTLQEQAVVLSAALQEQQAVDWQHLLNTDPVEYLKQQHLAQQRQAALQRTQQEQQKLYQQQQQEQQQSVRKYIAEQQEALLAKLPEWKDDKKATAEKQAISDYLTHSGYTAEEVGNAADHRAIILARKAMLYDKMIASASAAAKKVSDLPNKPAIRPGSGSAPAIDKRGAAFQKLTKTGSIRDAASVFESFL